MSTPRPRHGYKDRLLDKKSTPYVKKVILGAGKYIRGKVKAVD